jgi:hypothetical protein
MYRLLVLSCSQRKLGTPGEHLVGALKDMIDRTPGSKPLGPEVEQAMRELVITTTPEHHLDPNSGLAPFARHAAATDGKEAQSQSDEYVWAEATPPSTPARTPPAATSSPASGGAR